jgi:uncharacterized membrane protein YagU involved in acid resistance
VADCLTPAGAVARGALAGIAGTAVMTGWQLLAAKLRAPGEKDTGAQDDPPQDPWDAASAPAKVAKRIGEGVFQREVSPDLIPLLTNVMHWGYGTGWGAVYGIAAGGRQVGTVRAGAAFGTAVWASSYAQLVPMGLYEPPWKYPPAELALDLSYHVVYGLGAAAAFRVLAR